jgi:hypothetical protein
LKSPGDFFGLKSGNLALSKGTNTFWNAARFLEALETGELAKNISYVTLDY